MTCARAEEYRRRAQEWLDAARLISIETSGAALLDMAQSWLRLAEEQDAQEEIIRSPVSEQPQAAAQQQQQQQVQPKDDDKKEWG
jgi:hypothetical protein